MAKVLVFVGIIVALVLGYNTSLPAAIPHTKPEPSMTPLVTSPSPVVGESISNNCYIHLTQGSIVKFEVEYKYGYTVVFKFDAQKPIRKYMTKTFLVKHNLELQQVDCEAFDLVVKT